MVWRLIAVSLLPFLHGSAQTTLRLDERSEEDSLQCSVPSQRALLQRKQVETKIEHDVHEKVRMVVKSTLDEEETLPEEFVDINFSRVQGGQRATVGFAHLGHRFEMNLTPATLYSHGARLARHTKDGEVPFTAGLPSVYTSRAPGSWASVVVQEHGFITGLFERNGRVLRVKPADKSKRTRQQYLVHTLHQPVLGVVGTERADAISTILQASGSTAVNFSKHEVAIDGQSSHVSNEETPSGTGHVEVKHDPSWKEHKGWGECYPGDDQLHRLTLNIIADENFYRYHGGQTRARLEEAVSEASFLYERLMNIRLEISNLMIYESSVGAPSFAVGCANDHDSDLLMMRKLDQLVRDQQTYFHFQGATHLFTGCGMGFGTVGLAYIGTVCELDGYNAGVNQFTHQGGWPVFAHELGHNFGAHSLLQGKGLPDGHGTFNGEFQFNSRHRNREVCNVLSSVGNCYGKFTRDWGGTLGNCHDTPGYTDKYGFKCSHWRGHNCSTYSSWWFHYTGADLLSVVRNCPSSCGLCSP